MRAHTPPGVRGPTPPPSTIRAHTPPGVVRGPTPPPAALRAHIPPGVVRGPTPPPAALRAQNPPGDRNEQAGNPTRAVLTATDARVARASASGPPATDAPATDAPVANPRAVGGRPMDEAAAPIENVGNRVVPPPAPPPRPDRSKGKSSYKNALMHFHEKNTKTFKEVWEEQKAYWEEQSRRQKVWEREVMTEQRQHDERMVAMSNAALASAIESIIRSRQQSQVYAFPPLHTSRARRHHLAEDRRIRSLLTGIIWTLRVAAGRLHHAIGTTTTAACRQHPAVETTTAAGRQHPTVEAVTTVAGRLHRATEITPTCEALESCTTIMRLFNLRNGIFFLTHTAVKTSSILMFLSVMIAVWTFSCKFIFLSE